MTKLRVGLIFGGRSGEHEVSLMSAASVYAAMDKSRYDVVPIAITRSGRWMLPGDSERALKEGVDRIAGQTLGIRPEPGAGGLVPMGANSVTAGSLGQSVHRLDVIFPVLHGTFGEDGTVQGLLELVDVPYVGAGVLGSAVGMDKVVQKALLREQGLPVVDHRLVLRSRWELEPEAVLDDLIAQLVFPLFVKPANLGSSVGISKAHNRAELHHALDVAAQYDRRLIVEQGIDAREIECSVLGNEQPEASVPGEIVPAHEFYDYEAKYLVEGSQLIIPARLSAELSEQVRRLSIAAFQALDCAGLARVDFLLDRQRETLYVNEVNTMPGFTRISMYPKLWEASGLPYPKLIDRLIELALERHRDKARNRTDFVPGPA